MLTLKYSGHVGGISHMSAHTPHGIGHVGGISHMSAHTPHGIEVCLKTLVVYIIKLHIFSNFWSGNILQTVL